MGHTVPRKKVFCKVVCWSLMDSGYQPQGTGEWNAMSEEVVRCILGTWGQQWELLEFGLHLWAS